MHGMHIINPHRRHTKRSLTLKYIARIWTSGGLSVDCYVQERSLWHTELWGIHLKLLAARVDQ